MNAFHLFAGAGGGILASLLLGHEIIGANEIDKYCCDILRQRQIDKCLPDFPIWQMDIREFNERIAPTYAGMVDLLCGGFPCQPFSVAGKGRGKGDRRNMWPATLDAMRIIRPTFCFFENVPGLRSHPYYTQILFDLRNEGYDAHDGILSAGDCGATHKRDRLWIFANSTGDGYGESFQGGKTEGEKLSCLEQSGSRGTGKVGGRFWWSGEPGIPRVDDGVANWMERTKATGNGQIPIVAAVAETILMRSFEGD